MPPEDDDSRRHEGEPARLVGLAAANQSRRDAYDDRIEKRIRGLRTDREEALHAALADDINHDRESALDRLRAARAWVPSPSVLMRYIRGSRGGREYERLRGAVERLRVAGRLDPDPAFGHDVR